MNQPLIPLPLLITRRGISHAKQTVLRSKNRGIWKSITWSELDAAVRGIGTALLSAGVGRGNVVAILSEARPEAAYADLAVLGCGAAGLAIDPNSDHESVGRALSSTGARLAFVENEEQLDKVLTIRGRCPALLHIVVFDVKGLRDVADAEGISLDRFTRAGGSADWATKVQAIEPDQPAIIQWRPGEHPIAGRTLTHGDLAHMIEAARTRLPIQPKDERLVVLPISDITERVWGLYLALESGCISNYPEGPDTVIENLQELRPTILGGDAALWTHLHALAADRAKVATVAQRLAYEWALRAARRHGADSWLPDLLVLRAVRWEFGLNRLRTAYIGGDAISPTAIEWTRCLGITIHRINDLALGTGHMDERYQALLQDAYA